MGDVLRVLPYSNTLTLAECTGQQVLDALEWGAHSLPGIFGGFLEVSGLTYEVNPTIPSPCVQDDQNRLDHIDGNMARRVGNVLVNGVPLDPEKTYKVCMTSYLFEGGYGYSMFEGCTALLQDMAADNEALINYLKSLPDGALQERYGDPYGDGRIVAVGENRAE
jgi:2',3'-cyclic-nucleotide 2'-phosphodiesterase (5'-nucleotidase family)